jgi:hypothetical protein
MSPRRALMAEKCPRWNWKEDKRGKKINDHKAAKKSEIQHQVT